MKGKVSEKIKQIEVVAETIKPTMLGKLIAIQKLLQSKLESKLKYTESIKIEIITQKMEIESLIGIINYMDNSQTTRKFNIK